MTISVESVLLRGDRQTEGALADPRAPACMACASLVARIGRSWKMSETVEGQALGDLMVSVYEELKALAAYHLQQERRDHTLQPTALVHEAYVKLMGQRKQDWASRTQFFRVAAQQVRRVLVDHARSHKRQKRHGGRMKVSLTENLAVAAADVDILALNVALDKLDSQSSEDREIVELKYFGGLTESEIAEALGMSDRTVRRRWTFARAWLFKELAGDTEQAHGG